MWIWYRHFSWVVEVGWKEKYQEGRLWMKDKRISTVKMYAVRFKQNNRRKQLLP
jgi:hypothetical protein